MSDKAKYGYLAGIIDGEGSITITKTHNKQIINSDGTNSTLYMCNFGARNTDFKLIKWLMEKFGGTYYKDKKKAGWKPAYRWALTKHKDQEILLLAIMPYLVIKKEQAKIALNFIRLNGERSPEKREEMFYQLQLLNKRGEIVETNTLDSLPNCRPAHGPVVTANLKIESELIGNNKSAPVVIQNA